MCKCSYIPTTNPQQNVTIYINGILKGSIVSNTICIIHTIILKCWYQ